MKKLITKRLVDGLQPGTVVADTEVRGFYVRCLPSGVTTYGFRYRDRISGRRRWLSIGLHGNVTPHEAREIARGHGGAVSNKRDPLGEEQASKAAHKAARTNPEKTVGDVLDEHMERYADKQAARSSHEKRRIFDKYVKPVIGDTLIREIRRSEIVALLDRIEDKNGPVMADRTLAHVRKAFAWHATRDDQFNSPIVRGMSRIKPRERARDRILDDNEISDVWSALDKVGPPFSILVRTLLLTAQRRDEVARMHRSEIQDKTWVIPASRYKTNRANAVPLTGDVMDILPKAKERKGYLFTTTNKVPFSGFSKAKRALDDAIAKNRAENGLKPMKPWVLHDLRRTARSLMSRAGVRSEIAERVLGHVIAGVEGVYDRHDYLAEKRDALEKLATMIAQILEPPASNVVSLSRGTKLA